MNRSTLTAIVFGFVFLFVVNSLAAVVIDHRINALHGNICTVVDQGRAGEVKDAQYWSSAAARARNRALIDMGSLKAADIDSADSDHRRAIQDLNAVQFTFPGC